ncbi:type II 3-dehydroquinate dehydratase [Pluralibacter gergoviae]|uniref:3-dehydroquinate dehydratase n=1 Tax=Pluralibacter gergoviae TaxID=61647 RepID=A0AAW8HTJ1_PLUGE|nr:type II 3-dehydroquinate dehydratase [Pluralibacter gergoviae]AIR02052.1 3-dehydroquinate dehydratase [Pluralibacter gergoviae]AVR03663.1 3-dehydroquinate dehydratase [Pluralibacter gergoviae]ELG9928496.1 3-dehydroquinate dehydratase [Pluralibacter gergoviae]ELK5593830.1 3-dehydroquinate dehydratase [Pluralibacter gergoviae]KMK03046.1 3-dehydroquinate dehydratase [Pluralibacter gergoviae]
MNTRVFMLNGPNLNMLGRREPEIYGTTTLASIRLQSEKLADELGLACDFRQTNHEGVMVDWVQEAFESEAAVIVNPAGLSFHSVPLLDALKLITRPLVEVHLSNIHARDEYHRHSMTSTVARGVIAGCGAEGYSLALRAVAAMLKSGQ